jgi:uncharacterized membrane protein
MIGMLAAICAIATTLKVPLPTGAMVHLGTAAIFIIGIAFGGVYAGIAGAIGSAFFDLLMGFSPYTLWSFVIKGVAGLIVGTIAKGLWPKVDYYNSGKRWLGKALLGCVLAALWTLGGYILAWWQVLGSLAVALGNIPASLLTSGIGMIVALLLSPKIRKLVNR